MIVILVCGMLAAAALSSVSRNETVMEEARDDRDSMQNEALAESAIAYARKQLAVD